MPFMTAHSADVGLAPLHQVHVDLREQFLQLLLFGLPRRGRQFAVVRRFAAEASKSFEVPSPFESIDKATRQSLAPPVPPAGKLNFLDLQPIEDDRIGKKLQLG